MAPVDAGPDRGFRSGGPFQGGRFRARVAIELKGERLREMWIRSLDGLPVVAELSNRYVDRLSRLSSAPDGK